MENVDISGKAKNLIRFGLAGLIALSAAIGYATFQHYHAEKILQISDAKVIGHMVSVNSLASGKVIELTFEDGDEVQAGDVIAKIQVNVTEEELKQLEKSLEVAKKNYETLKRGQRVRTPVRRSRPATVTPPRTNSSAGANTIATLEERAKRMQELYEMGAVSAAQRDEAREALAKARVSAAVPATPAPATETVEFVEEFRPTPPAVLTNAENAVKQAELALNVAKQESQQTEILAPVNGVVYYSAAADGELKSGDTVAQIGNAKELWLEAEVSEEVFNQISLGKTVSYTLDGHNLQGTVTEKISPPKPEETPAEEILPPEETPSSEENKSEEKSDEQPEKPAEEPAEKIPEEPAEEKYLVKFSLPAERDFDCKPNTLTTIKIVL